MKDSKKSSGGGAKLTRGEVKVVQEGRMLGGKAVKPSKGTKPSKSGY